MFGARAWGQYPSEELVAFVSRTYGPLPGRDQIQLLDLGCGPGANVWFLAREGYRVSGIDGSKVAIERAEKRLAADGLKAQLRVGDLVNLPFADGMFQGAFDIAAVQHNRLGHCERIIAQVHRVLAPGGKLFAILIGEGSWGEGTGAAIEPGTFESVNEGPAVGCGIIHFFSEADLSRLFREFSELSYERRERTLKGRTKRVVQWIVTASK